MGMLSDLIANIRDSKRRISQGRCDGKEGLRRKIMEACVLSSELKAKYVSKFLLKKLCKAVRAMKKYLNVLVWVHFHRMSDQLMEEFKRNKVEVYQYDGRQNAASKIAILEKFDSEEPGVRVLVAGINSMQAGITLRHVEKVFFTENYFSAIGIDQAVARTRRIGVNTDTVYTFLEVEGTFDGYINAIVDRKAALIEKTMR